MDCPICGRKIENYTYDYINHTMCEEHAECSDEYHYYGYTYEYGNSIETIGDIAFHEYYSKNPTAEERKIHNEIYESTLELMRENYKQKAGIL